METFLTQTKSFQGLQPKRSLQKISDLQLALFSYFMTVIKKKKKIQWYPLENMVSCKLLSEHCVSIMSPIKMNHMQIIKSS